jgi:hypothetical protein
MIDTRESRSAASEVKFVVTPSLGEEVRAWARRHLEPDPHGKGPFGDEYRTTTLYFDTNARDVFHRRGSNGRAKYRIRRYDEYDFVFVERKLRRPGLLVKRRSQVPLDALARLREGGQHGPWLGQWFERRTLVRGLRPACQLVYRRTARSIATSLGPARLTVDAELGAALATAVTFEPFHPVPALDRQMIVELKFRGPAPAVFKRLIEEFRLTPQTASKYRLGVAALTGLPLDTADATSERSVGA